MKHTASISWQRNLNEPFVDNKYSRRHTWKFDGGLQVAASSSPYLVPLPYSDGSAIDPEEAFVASVSSCHMLFFLSIAASKGYLIERYIDEAEGLMIKSENGKMSIGSITLHPTIIYSGEWIPSREEIEEMHHLSHEKCFIANSIKTEININLE